MFSIDGRNWPYPCDIERVAEMKPSDVAGLMLDKNYFNDVLGTYMSYTVSVVVPINKRDDYTPIYETLTDPAESHTFILPYNQEKITVNGRVENVSDTYVRLANGGVYWRGMKFTVIANHPSRTYTLSEALTRGRAPVPAVAQPSEGDVYMWFNGQWDKVQEYPDADVIRY